MGRTAVGKDNPMELSERQMQILQAIIVNYLETAEPVGSRTISRRFPFGISSATIRNEMADLEELGLVEQPHTSAGRIPSAKGYRLYVDELMRSESVSSEQWETVRTILKNKSLQLDSLLREIGDLLASVTSYTTIVTTPHLTKSRMKHVQLVPLDQNSVVLVAITDGNMVRNHVIPVRGGYTQEGLDRLTAMLNEQLTGLTLGEITLPLLQKIKRETNMDQGTMDSFMEALHDTLKSVDDVGVYTSGASNMLNFPEFSDVNRARGFMEFLQQKDEVKRLVKSDVDYEGLEPDEGQVRIAIGSENKVEQLSDCSVITATYRYKDMELGSISVVGPMRMDYDRVVGQLRHIAHDFPRLFDSENAAQKNNREEDET